MLAPERNREHSIGDQAVTLNVGFMERLRRIMVLAPEGNREHSISRQLSAWNVGFMERLRRTATCSSRPDKQ